MSEYIKMNQNLIKHLLSMLEGDFGYTADPDAFRLAELSTSFDEPQIYAAYELKKFMDKMPGGFLIYRADEKEEILYVNRALLRIFGCETPGEFQELTENSFRGIVHPDELLEVEESIREQIEHSQYDLDYVEYRIIRKDGEIRWVEDYGHFIRSESAGDFFYVFISDATEKVQQRIAERTALLNEKLLKEKILQNQIAEYDKELKVIHQEHLRRLEVIEGLSVNYDSILYVNLDTDKILPYRLSEMTKPLFGRKFHPRSLQRFQMDYVSTLVHPEDRTSYTRSTDPDYIRSKLSAVKTYYFNYRIQADGEIQYLQLRVANVGGTGVISRVVFGYRRVDEEIRFEMEQKKLYEDALNHARLANIAKDTFLSNMSHDMRTPLNAITGFTTLARNHVRDTDKIQEYLDKISISSQQLLYLVNDILEISRMESATVQLEEAECNLLELMQDIQETLLDQVSGKDITVDLSGIIHHNIFCDSNKLKQILLRLIGNAIKFTGDGGWIQITGMEKWDSSTDYAVYRFSVEDNGIGIEADYLEHIFEPFERLRNTTLSGIHGIGLGLTIAQKYVEMMGGHIDVQSIPGKGSCFTVILSLRIQNLLAPHKEGAEVALVQFLGRRKLLLVDDNEFNRELEAELLEDAGFMVDVAEDGSIAVEKVLSAAPGSYALILMDIQMPVMDGYEATRVIRKIENPSLAEIPIIAVSANAYEEDRRMARESGMNAHLPKPLDLPVLFELMTEILFSTESGA